MNNSRKISWSLGCLRVSKIDKRMRPAVPTMAQKIVKAERTFWAFVISGTRRPL
jgi:hypothetical protein